MIFFLIWGVWYESYMEHDETFLADRITGNYIAIFYDARF